MYIFEHFRGLLFCRIETGAQHSHGWIDKGRNSQLLYSTQLKMKSFTVKGMRAGRMELRLNEIGSEVHGLGARPRVGTPIPGHGREVPRWWPLFWGFSIRLGPYFIPQHNPIDPIFHWFSVFLTPHFHKTLDPIGSKKIACWTWLPNIWWSTPPPPS